MWSYEWATLSNTLQGLYYSNEHEQPYCMSMQTIRLTDGTVVTTPVATTDALIGNSTVAIH